MPKQYNDLPEVSCGLDRKAWVNNIVTFIKQAEAPKTIAVNGGWGSGKTSTLIQINNALGGDFNNGIVETGATLKEGNLYIKTVWFEAWKYQNEASIVQALLFEIREQLTAFVKGLNTMDNALRASVIGLLQSIDLTFKHSSNLAIYSNDTSLSFKKPFKEIKESYNQIKENRLSQPLPTFTLQKMLRDAIDQLIKLSVSDQIKNKFKQDEDKIKTKLVIIIDDLDRCEPEVAFAIFEAMKLYLNFDNCIFLLGIDQKAIERIIQLKYEKENTKATSKLYLEKIVQDVFHIPLLDKDQKLQYFKTLTKELKTVHPIVNKVLLKHLNENNILPPIPRSIKIYVNTLFAFLEAHKNLEAKEETKIQAEDVSTLIIVSYLYAYHYEIYTAMCHYDKFVVILKNFCKNREEFENLNEDDMENLPACLNGLILPILLEEERFKTVFKNDVEAEEFPVDKLRQVFWIRAFINKEKNNLTLERVKKFKF